MPLLACGSNGSGQLALGHADDVSSFAPCLFDPACPEAEVVDLVSTASHALLLLRTPEGVRLLGAGTNTHGQLGLGCALTSARPARTAFTPTSIARDAGLDERWIPTRVAATWTSSFVVFQRDDGAAGGTPQVVVACGSNDFGELGSRGGGVVRVDLGLAGDEWVEHLKGGQRHVVAVVSRGRGEGRTQRVVGWGAARRGELDAVPLPVEPRGKGKGKAPARDATRPPTTITLAIPPDAHIVDLALGASHSLALLDTGRILAWGSDQKGQLAGIADADHTDAIAASWGGSYLLSKGTVYSQGANTHGQVVRLPGAERRVPLEGSTARALVAGSEHVLVLDDAGRLWTGGWNEHGNLGLGDEKDRAMLVDTGVVGRRVWGGCAASWVWVD